MQDPDRSPTERPATRGLEPSRIGSAETDGALADPALRRRSKRKALLIGLGGVGLAGLALILLFLGFLTLAKKVPASEEDLRLVLTLDELEAWLEGYWPDRTKESAWRTTYPDRTYQIEYEYDSDELYLQSSFTQEDGPASAIVAYGATQLGWRIGASGLELVEADLLRWGDQSDCYLILHEGRTIGNRFIAREGARVFDMTLTGTSFEDAQRFAELVLPVLRRIEALPQAAPRRARSRSFSRRGR